MDSRRELVILAVALTAACCIFGSALYLSSDHEGKGDDAVTDEDFIGCWYLVETVRSYNDGTVVDIAAGDSGDAFLSDRSLHLFSVDSGLVYGTYGGEGITGYVLGNQVMLYFEKHGNYTLFTGHLEDGFLVLVNAHSDKDADCTTTALCAGISVYSKDPARPLMDMTGICPDLSGVWMVSSSRIVTESYDAETTVTGMKINWMKDGVFTGLVSFDGDGTVQTVEVKGALASNGKGYSGLMSEINYGGTWVVTYSDGVLRIATSDIESMKGEAGGEEVVFTRDGSKRQIDAIPQSISGTSWMTVSSKSIGADGARSSDGNEYVLDFDEITGDLVHGVSAYGTRSANVFVYYLCDVGDEMHRLQISWDAFHSALSIGMGMYVDGKLHLVECYIADDGTPITSVAVLEERKTSPGVDIVGHWYACYSVGYDSANGYMESSYADSPDLAQYDIDILTYDDGLVYGVYMDAGISASISNGFVNMDVVYPDGDKIKTVRGWFDNDVMVLITCITGTPESDYSLSVFYVAYSKVRAPVTLNTPDMDPSGKWMSESYTKYLLDGSVKDLGDVDMEITETRKNVFIGTFGDVSFSGVYLNVYGGIAAVSVDTLGRQWYITGDADSLCTNTLEGEMWNVPPGDICAVFVRDGAHGSVDVPDLSGKTYSTPEIRVQYNDGSSMVFSRPSTLTIEGQEGNCIIGSCAIGEAEFDVVGSVFWINDTLVVRITLQNGPDTYGVPLGYLTFRDGATMLSLHTMSGALSATGVAEMKEAVS